MCVFFFFQAEDGIRDLVRSRGLGDVYKRQGRMIWQTKPAIATSQLHCLCGGAANSSNVTEDRRCLLYTSDAADERSSVDLGGRRIIKKKKADRGARR